jgi:hypothetical protein
MSQWNDAATNKPPCAGNYLAVDVLLDTILILYYTKRRGWEDVDGPTEVSHWQELPDMPADTSSDAPT